MSLSEDIAALPSRFSALEALAVKRLDECAKYSGRSRFISVHAQTALDLIAAAKAGEDGWRLLVAVGAMLEALEAHIKLSPAQNANPETRRVHYEEGQKIRGSLQWAIAEISTALTTYRTATQGPQK